MVLPYDQIPRLGDDGHNGVLGVALAQWAARDDTRADPEARQAANTAVDAIDAVLGELHALRAPPGVRGARQRRCKRRPGRCHAQRSSRGMT
jgi:hypothetical protein